MIGEKVTTRAPVIQTRVVVAYVRDRKVTPTSIRNAYGIKSFKTADRRESYAQG